MLDEKDEQTQQMALPIFQYKENIIQTIKKNAITLVCG